MLAGIPTTWSEMGLAPVSIERICLQFLWCKEKKGKWRMPSDIQWKYENENKIIDFSSLPSCQYVLKLYISRANIVAKIWNSTEANQPDLPHISAYVWTENGDMVLMEMAFPENIENLLMKLEDSEDVQWWTWNGRWHWWRWTTKRLMMVTQFLMLHYSLILYVAIYA